MKSHKGLWVGVIFAILLVMIPMTTFAAESSQVKAHYERAIVLQSRSDLPGVKVKIVSGPQKDKIVTAQIGAVTTSLDLKSPHYDVGDTVIVSIGTNDYSIIDHYRLSFAWWLLFAVLLLAVYFAGWRGVGSILGLILSVCVIASFMIPRILAGDNVYVVTIIGIAIISLIGMLVSHGVSRRTVVALGSTYLTLVLAVGLSALAVSALNLSGISNESVFSLSQLLPGIDVRGLLLCGMIISLVGILDDITVGQATVVEELQRANPKLGHVELYKAGLRIGREHIASLINTLVLAYVGTSFIFIVYLASISTFPILVTLNSELVMEEIVRSLVGSAALILAVPITTFMATRLLKPQAQAIPASEPRSHSTHYKTKS